MSAEKVGRLLEGTHSQAELGNEEQKDQRSLGTRKCEELFAPSYLFTGLGIGNKSTVGELGNFIAATAFDFADFRGAFFFDFVDAHN